MFQFPYSLIFLFFVSTLLAYILLQSIKWAFRRAGVLDRPHLYPSEGDRPPAPYAIGIIIWIMLLVMTPVILHFFDFTPTLERRLWIFVALGGLVTLVSFLDDLDTIGKIWFSIPPWVRLLFQICIGATIGITSIKISYLSNVFWGVGAIFLDEYFSTFTLGNLTLTIYYIPILVTIFWYVLVMNALNWSDGIPWLTGGISVIAFLILTGLAIKLYLIDTTLPSQENSRFVLTILMVLLPATFLLTRSDISRHGLMGDSGTMMLAFSLATLSIIAWGKIATAVSVLGIYLIDLFYVVMMRLISGKNPMRWDRTHHLHYRLMELGFTPTMTRYFIFILSFLFGLGAIFLDKTGKIILILIIAVIVVFITKILSNTEKRKRKQ